MTSDTDTLVVHPLELLELIARAGAGHKLPELGDDRLTSVAKTIEENPRVPLGFRVYEGTRYNGKDEDAPDGVLFSLLADLEIIHQMYTRQSEASHTYQSSTRILGSGAAILLLVALRVRKNHGLFEIAPLRDSGFADLWTAPERFNHDDYEKGRLVVQDWIKSLTPTFNQWKSDEDLARIRKTSVEDMNRSEVLRIFPSHLLYIMAQFGSCADLLRGQYFKGDNMYEIGLAIRKNPERPLMFVAEHCMLCPTCKVYDPDGCGLCGIQPECRLRPDRNNMCNRLQLRLLRTLDTEYYRPEPAVDLVKRAFKKVRTDHTSFTYKGAPPSAYAYTRCRYSGMGFLDAYDDPEAVVKRVSSLLNDTKVQRLLPDADRAHANEVLGQARQALARQDREQAYQALIDEPFHFVWKFYMEKVVAGFARLPPTITTERRQEHDLPCLEAERIDTCEHLATDLGSPPWAGRPFAGGFRTTAERPAIAETAFRVLHDARSLAIGCIGADVDTTAIKAEHRTGLEARVGHDCCRTDREHWLHVDDSFSVMLQPDEQSDTFFVFTFNAKGIKLGERRSTEALDENVEWIFDTDWHVHTHIGDDAWTGVAIIPFACLGLDGPGRTAWRMNVHRFIRNDTLDAHSWAPPGLRKFYKRTAFGRLRFA